MDNGIPCMFPEGVVKGECKSACASIHITTSFLLGWEAFIPSIIPPAEEWSPEITIGKLLLLQIDFIFLASLA